METAFTGKSTHVTVCEMSKVVDAFFSFDHESFSQKAIEKASAKEIQRNLDREN